jgi:hypothetical protein
MRGIILFSMEHNVKGMCVKNLCTVDQMVDLEYNIKNYSIIMEKLLSMFYAFDYLDSYKRSYM